MIRFNGKMFIALIWVLLIDTILQTEPIKNKRRIEVMSTLVSFKGWFHLLRFAKSVKCKAPHVYVILNGISL